MNEALKTRKSGAKNQRPAVIDIVSRLQRADPQLSLAERQVAGVITSDYEAATRMTIADLAAKAKVSQPTVTRFCRSLGCTSFADFKISLARTLTVASAYLKSNRVFSDDAVPAFFELIVIRAGWTLGRTARTSSGAVLVAVHPGDQSKPGLWCERSDQ